MPFRRLEISFSQGAEWKALIRKYITAIVSKEAPWCVTEQSKSAWPTLRAAVSSAMIKKVGEAARASNRTATALMLSGIIKMVFVMLWLFAISRVLSARDRGQRRPTTTYSFLEGQPI